MEAEEVEPVPKRKYLRFVIEFEAALGEVLLYDFPGFPEDSLLSWMR